MCMLSPRCILQTSLKNLMGFNMDEKSEPNSQKLFKSIVETIYEGKCSGIDTASVLARVLVQTAIRLKIEKEDFFCAMNETWDDGKDCYEKELKTKNE